MFLGVLDIDTTLATKAGENIEWDTDNNKYLDALCGLAVTSLGHSDPDIADVISKQSNSLPLNPDLLYECSSLIRELVPSAESIRFLNTGTEAVMSAIRIARAYSGKSKIVKFHGHYHGQHDEFLIAIDKSKDLFSHGVPPSSINKVIVEPFNSIKSLEKLFKKDSDIAAVIMDASMHAGGLWGTTRSYLKELRRLTKKYKIILIFDEVITGFRLSSGGAQKCYGITPDLSTFAKAMGAGEKIAAVAGKKNIMSILDPSIQSDKYVFQSGTVNDGTGALSSAIAALKIYKSYEQQGKYILLNNKAIKLKEGLIHIFNELNIPCQINQVGSMLQIFISPNNIDFFKPDKRFNKIIAGNSYTVRATTVGLSLPTSKVDLNPPEDINSILSISKYVLNYYNFNKLDFDNIQD